MSTQVSESMKANSDEIDDVWEVFAEACCALGVTPDRFGTQSIDAEKLALTETEMLSQLESINENYPELTALVSETRQKLVDISKRSSPPPPSPVPAVPQRFEPTEEAKQFIRHHAERFAPLCEGSVTDVYSERCTRIHVVQGNFARCVAFHAYKTNTEAKESLLAWIGQVVNSEDTEKRWSDEIRTWLRRDLRAEVLEAAIAMLHTCKLQTLRGCVARLQNRDRVPSATEERGIWVTSDEAHKVAASLVSLLAKSPQTEWIRALKCVAHALASCTHQVVSTMWRVYSGAQNEQALFSETYFRTFSNVLTWLHVKVGLPVTKHSWLFATANEDTPRVDYLSNLHVALADKEGAEDLKSIFVTDDVLACVNLLSEFQLFYPAATSLTAPRPQRQTAVRSQRRGVLPPKPWSFALYRNSAILITPWTPEQLRDDSAACVVDLKTYVEHDKRSQTWLRDEVGEARDDQNVVLLVYFRTGARKELFDADTFPRSVTTAVDLGTALHGTIEAKPGAARAATEAASDQAAADETTTGQSTGTSVNAQYAFILFEDPTFPQYVSEMQHVGTVRPLLFTATNVYVDALEEQFHVELPTQAATVAAPASTAGAVEVSGSGE